MLWVLGDSARQSGALCEREGRPKFLFFVPAQAANCQMITWAQSYPERKKNIQQVMQNKSEKYSRVYVLLAYWEISGVLYF